MRFLVSEIRDAGHLHRHETFEAAGILGTPPEMVWFKKPVVADVDASMTRQGELVFSGRVATTFTFQCGRCLETFDRPADLEFQQVVTPEGTEVDLSNEIRETVFLDLPVSAVCRENCRGICPTCGINLNKSNCDCASTRSDLRWNALKDIRFKK